MTHFNLSTTAEAAEVSTDILSRWLRTSVIQMRGDDVDSHSSGVPRQFSVPRIKQIAATQALTKLGITPGRAASAALSWTDNPPQNLAPGEQYAEGGTWLILDDAGARVVNVPTDATLSEAVVGRGGWAPGAAVLLDLRRLSNRIDARLGVSGQFKERVQPFETKDQ